MYVVGLVGPFGSGCSYVAKKIVENHGYEYLSLSDVLREEYKKENPNKRDLPKIFGKTYKKEALFAGPLFQRRFVLTL